MTYRLDNVLSFAVIRDTDGNLRADFDADIDHDLAGANAKVFNTRTGEIFYLSKNVNGSLAEGAHEAFAADVFAALRLVRAAHHAKAGGQSAIAFERTAGGPLGEEFHRFLG